MDLSSLLKDLESSVVAVSNAKLDMDAANDKARATADAAARTATTKANVYNSAVVNMREIQERVNAAITESTGVTNQSSDRVR